MMHPDPSQPAADRVMGTLLASHRRFLDFLTARVGRREDAEDILQSAFVRGVQKAAEIRDDESAVAWFYRLLRNALTDYYRHKAAGTRALESYGREVSEAAEGMEADLEGVICACVHDLIPTLKPEYGELIRRVDLGGANVASLAGELGLTDVNARVRLHRARAALRKELERSCRTCATHGCLDCTCSSSSNVRP